METTLRTGESTLPSQGPQSPCPLPGPSASEARKRGTELAMVRHTDPLPRQLPEPGGGAPLRRGHRCELRSDVGHRHQILGHLPARGEVQCEPQLLNGDRTERVGVHRLIALLGRLPGPRAIGVDWGTGRKAPLIFRSRPLPGCLVNTLIGEWS